MKNRMYNFVREDGKCIILAIDHGALGTVTFDDPTKILEAAVQNGVDGVLSNLGIIKKYRSSMGHAGVMLRLDTFASVTSGREEVPANAFNIGDIVKYGIDGVMCMGYTNHKINGVEVEGDSFKMITKMVQECDKYGLVSAVEMLPNGFSSAPEDSSESAMKVACHIASELGVDLIKTRCTKDNFAAVVKNCYAPVVALGGAYTTDTRASLQTVRDAMDAGCIGIAMGRNIHARPVNEVASFVRALNKIVHEDASVNEAMEELDF